MTKMEETEKYTWKQTLQDVEMFVKVPAGVKSREIRVDFTKSHLTVSIRGETLLNVCLYM